MATKPKITLASLATRIDELTSVCSGLQSRIVSAEQLHTGLQNDFSKHHRDFVTLQKNHAQLDDAFAGATCKQTELNYNTSSLLDARVVGQHISPLQEFANRLSKLTRRQTEWFQDRMIDQNVALAYADWHRFGRNVRQGETSIGSLLFLRSQTFLKNVHVAHDYLYQQIAGYYQQWDKLPPEVCQWLAEAATLQEH